VKKDFEYLDELYYQISLFRKSVDTTDSKISFLLNPLFNHQNLYDSFKSNLSESNSPPYTVFQSLMSMLIDSVLLIARTHKWKCDDDQLENIAESFFVQNQLEVLSLQQGDAYWNFFKYYNLENAIITQIRDNDPRPLLLAYKPDNLLNTNQRKLVLKMRKWSNIAGISNEIHPPQIPFINIYSLLLYMYLVGSKRETNFLPLLYSLTGVSNNFITLYTNRHLLCVWKVVQSYKEIEGIKKTARLPNIAKNVTLDYLRHVHRNDIRKPYKFNEITNFNWEYLSDIVANAKKSNRNFYDRMSFNMSPPFDLDNPSFLVRWAKAMPKPIGY